MLQESEKTIQLKVYLCLSIIFTSFACIFTICKYYGLFQQEAKSVNIIVLLLLIGTMGSNIKILKDHQKV